VIEKKLTQFSAAAATILLVNIKQDEVTRHSSQYKAILETLCQSILERYEGDDSYVTSSHHLSTYSYSRSRGPSSNSLRQPVTLLYVVRDWDGSMSTDAAESHIMRTMLEVWERVTREMEMTYAQFADHFMLAVATLPHKVRISYAIIFIIC
jgi:hypothetical protein